MPLLQQREGMNYFYVLTDYKYTLTIYSTPDHIITNKNKKAPLPETKKKRHSIDQLTGFYDDPFKRYYRRYYWNVSINTKTFAFV